MPEAEQAENSSWLAQAVAAANAQDWVKAEGLLASQAEQGHAGALHLLGLVRRAQGQSAQAQELFERALENGGSEELYLELARLAFETEDYPRVRHYYQLAQSHQVGLEDSDWHRFANALTATGEARASLAIYQQLLQHYPEHAQLWMHLGNARLALGHLDSALTAFDKSLSLEPGSGLLHYNRARALHAQGRYEESENTVRRSLALDNTLPAAWSLLGSVLQRRGRPEDAQPAFETGLKLDPDDALIWNNLGTCLQAQYQAEAADAAYRQAMTHMPELWEARLNLAHLQRERGHSAEALALMAGLLPAEPLLSYQMAFVLPVIQDSSLDQPEWHRRFQQALDVLEAEPMAIEDPIAQVGHLPFYLPYLGVNERPLLEQLGRIFTKACPILNWRAPQISKPRAPGPWRIGLLSGYFYQHTVNHLFGYLVPELRRQGLNVTALYSGRRQDAFTNRVAAEADAFVHLSGDLFQARQQIAAQGLDLILSLDIGMDLLTYFLAFSRLAPIQMLTWGHPLTTGLDTQDLFLTSPGLAGPDGQQYYSERLHELPGFFAHWAPPPQTESPEQLRESFGLPSGSLYLCPQSLYKLHPGYDELLAGILEQDPDGRLVMLEGMYPEWRTRLEKRWSGKLDTRRLLWLDRVSPQDYVRLVGCGSVMLDTRPFGGGLTMLQALAQGVPVVSWPDASLKGRVTHGICLELDWPDGVADSAQDYIQKAVKLAQGWGEGDRVEMMGRYAERLRPEQMGKMVGAACVELCERRFSE